MLMVCMALCGNIFCLFSIQTCRGTLESIMDYITAGNDVKTGMANNATFCRTSVRYGTIKVQMVIDGVVAAVRAKPVLLPVP